MNENDEQINDMVNRFLRWRLPEDFMPDGGISFKRLGDHFPMPTGTNILNYDQAKELVLFMVGKTE